MKRQSVKPVAWAFIDGIGDSGAPCWGRSRRADQMSEYPPSWNWRPQSLELLRLVEGRVPWSELCVGDDHDWSQDDMNFGDLGSGGRGRSAVSCGEVRGRRLQCVAFGGLWWAPGLILFPPSADWRPQTISGLRVFGGGAAASVFGFGGFEMGPRIDIFSVIGD